MGIVCGIFIAALGGPLPALAGPLSLGPGIRGAAPAAVALPAHVAMAWAVSVQGPLRAFDLGSALPDMRSCLAGLTRLDLNRPEHWATLTPVLVELSSRGLDPKGFSALAPGLRQELLVSAVTRVAVEKRARAVSLILRMGTDRSIPDQDLDSVEVEVRALQEDALFLSERQARDVGLIARQAAVQRAERERRRVMEFAQENARRLAPGGTEEVIRTAIAPDGRRVRLVRSGTVYRVYYEGDERDVLRYDIADLESDGIPAFPVERGGRRGLHINGRVFWEDGRY